MTSSPDAARFPDAPAIRATAAAMADATELIPSGLLGASASAVVIAVSASVSDMPPS